VQSIFPFLLSVSEIKLQIQKSVLETEWKLYSLKTPSHDNVLQIHPGALNHGGYPLVSCCIAAAKHAKVPVTVHLDHGSEETAVIDSLELVSKTTADISYSLFGFSYISWTNQGM
jgi:fructose/tagatose bisphosphate aldolase